MTKKLSKKLKVRSLPVGVAPEPEAKPVQPQPLPLVLFRYPLHGKGQSTIRYVKIVEVDKDYVRGFEIVDQNIPIGESAGKYKVFDRNKIGGSISLLSFNSVAE